MIKKGKVKKTMTEIQAETLISEIQKIGNALYFVLFLLICFAIFEIGKRVAKFIKGKYQQGRAKEKAKLEIKNK
jgi:hypothetical protein